MFISPSCSILTSVQCCVMSQSCVAIETQSNPVTKDRKEPKRERKSSPLWNESVSPQGSQTTVHMSSHQLCSSLSLSRSLWPRYPPPILAIANCNRREPTQPLRNYMWRELKNQSNLKFSLFWVHTRDNAHSLKSTETL